MDVTVLIDDELALTGYVAAVNCGYMNKKPSLSVKINTYAGRMVKASVGKGFYFTRQKAADIVSQLVSGYPVEFVNQSVNDVVLPAFAVSATDKIEKVLNRLARLSDTLIYSDDAGRLVMTDKCRDKYTASALITGENIIDIYKNDNVYKAYETVTLHSQLPLADAYSLDNIVSSPVSGKSQGSGRQYHQTVDIASQSRLNAAISELEYDCYDLKVTGSSFRTTDDKLYPHTMGAGTVTIRIMTPTGFPDEELLRKVKEHIDSKRPVTVKRIFVLAPAAKAIDIEIANLDPDTPEMKEAIIQSLQQSFDNNAEPGGLVLVSRIHSAILSTINLVDYKLVSPTENIQCAAGEIAMLGDVTWS